MLLLTNGTAMLMLQLYGNETGINANIAWYDSSEACDSRGLLANAAGKVIFGRASV